MPAGGEGAGDSLAARAERPARSSRRIEDPRAAFASGTRAKRKIQRQPACKPGSVWRRGVSPVPRDDHSSGTAVASRLMRPTRATARRRDEGFRLLSPLFGLAPGGACHASRVAARAVRSYRTLSPLPVRARRPAVALSLGSPPPDVIRRRVSVEPGLSSAVKQRSSGRLAARGVGARGGKVKRRVLARAARFSRQNVVALGPSPLSCSRKALD